MCSTTYARAHTYTNIVSTPLCLCRTNSFGAFPLHAVSLHPSSAAAALLHGLRVIRALRCTRNSASKSWYVRTRLTQSHPPQRISFLIRASCSSPTQIRYRRSKFTYYFFFYFDQSTWKSAWKDRIKMFASIVICHRLNSIRVN